MRRGHPETWAEAGPALRPSEAQSGRGAGGEAGRAGSRLWPVRSFPLQIEITLWGVCQESLRWCKVPDMAHRLHAPERLHWFSTVGYRYS